jgi:hypothetical protein
MAAEVHHLTADKTIQDRQVEFARSNEGVV